jgi:hypothetical protein
VADVRLQRRAHAVRTVQHATAVLGALVTPGEGPARAAARRRLWQGLHHERARLPVRHRLANRPCRLEAAVPQLHRRLPRGRGRHPLSPAHAQAAMRRPQERTGYAGDDRRHRRQEGKDEVALRDSGGRVVAADRRASPLLRRLGPPDLCDRPAEEAAPDDLEPRAGRQGCRGRGVRGWNDLRGDERRSPLRPKGEHGRATLARRVLLAVRAPGVLLRRTGGGVWARLCREHGRDGLRVRSHDRAPALGTRGRDVRLLGAGGLAEHGLRRHLGRLVLGARRAHRGLPLALQRAGRDHGRLDCPRRDRLLLDIREVLAASSPPREERAASDLRAQRTQRAADLAVPRRPLLAGRRRPAPDLHRGQTAPLRADHPPADAPAQALAGAREVRSAEASKSASAMPVKGQTRNEFCKIRLRKSRTNIETANPPAPIQSVPARH